MVCLRAILSALILMASGVVSTDAEARFQARFSASIAEEYNDNVEFTLDNRTADFVTILTPALTLLYIPPNTQVPTFNTTLAMPAKIFAHNSNLNSFGDNQRFNLGYTYRQSERFSLRFSNTLSRVGQTRTGGAGESTDLGIGDPDLVSTGDVLTNNFRVGGIYRARPDVTVTGNFSSYYSNFLDEGGNTFQQSATIRGNWRLKGKPAGFIRKIPTFRAGDLVFRAGGRLTYIKSRNGDTDFVPSFDIGLTHLSDVKIQLTPTLILSGNFGLDFNTTSASNIPAVVPTFNLRLQKTWERARLLIGARNGITNSLGVSGPSLTTDVFASFNIRLARALTGFASINLPFFRTSDVDFNTVTANAGLRYLIKRWLTTSLIYRFRFRNAGAGAENTSLQEQGKITQNSITLRLNAFFDIYPNFGLARLPGSGGGGFR